MEHEALAVWLWRVVLGIRRRGLAKELQPLASSLQAKRVVERVSRFVAQDLHAPLVVAALHFEHLALFELFEPRVRQIERNGDAPNAVRGKPFVREPEMRTEHELSLRELVVQLVDARFERAA